MMYNDPLGYTTIGYGWALERKGITPSQASAILSDHVSDAHNDALELLIHYSIDDLSDVRVSIITEMIFQLGLRGTTKFVKFWEAVCDQEWSQAALEMIDSKWHSQTMGRVREMAVMFSLDKWEVPLDEISAIADQMEKVVKLMKTDQGR